MSSSKAKRLKKFNDNWLEEDDFKAWLKKVEEDDRKFKCSICKKTLNLSSSGRGAVSDHANGAKHKEIVKKRNFFLKPQQQVKLTDTTRVANEEDNIKAIVIWLLKTIESGFSNNSTDDIGDVLRSMDPNSKILESFKMKKTKASYVINHGLAPYFRDKLYTEINASDMLVLSFDESLNDVVQKCEMVLVIRYWSFTQNMVKTRYLDSAFFGHGRESDLLEHFKKLSSRVDRSKVYNVSMDGPRVNHNFLRSLKRDWEDELIHKLIDIGTCNLHIVSGAFKTGAEKSEWNIHKTLKGAYQIFHDSPARRDDYTVVTKSLTFPKFFSATRWVENQEPADRLISIWPNIKQLWSWWCKQKGKQPCSLTTKSIINVKTAVEDNLTEAKLQSFSFIAGKVHPFLIKYQTDKPMIPFLYRDLKLLLSSCMSLIAKKAVVDKKSGKILKGIDLHDDNNLVALKNVEIGFAADHTIKQMIKKDIIGSAEEKKFRKGYVTFVRSMLEKIFERSPVTSPILRQAALFDPENLASVPKETLTRSFKGLLGEFVELKIISTSQGDKALQEFSSFYDEERVVHLRALKDFSEKEQRLDTFFFNDIGIGKYEHLSFILRLLLTMSHGQSAVERNFSLKNNLEQDNQSDDTIVARRICKDYMTANKIKPFEIVLDKALILAVKSARSKYVKHLEQVAEEKKRTEEESQLQISLKRKKEEIEQVERDIHTFAIGVKEAEKAVDEGGRALETLCKKQRTDKDQLLTIQAKITSSLKRKHELNDEMKVIVKKKKDLNDELEMLVKQKDMVDKC